MSDTLKVLTVDGLKTWSSAIIEKNKQDKKIHVKKTNEWYELNSTIPADGEILIFSDHSTTTNENGDRVYVPDIKIGDGVHTIEQLAFISSGKVQTAIIAERLKHSLTIGEYIFDGSENVEIPVYTGDLMMGEYKL